MAKELNAKIQSKIVEYLEKRTEQSSITEISRDLDIGRNTVAKYLELLKFQGLVEQRSIGQANFDFGKMARKYNQYIKRGCFKFY